MNEIPQRHDDNQKKDTPRRNYIGARPTETLKFRKDLDNQTDLTKTLPAEPESLSHEELLKRFYEISLRCFNSENSLDMAKQLIKNLEEVHVKQMVVIQTLETAVASQKEVLKNLMIGVTNEAQKIKSVIQTSERD